MSILVKLWNLKFDQTLDKSLMKLNILLFQHINALQKLREEVQKLDIYCKAMTKKVIFARKFYLP
jgi:hypothetical protein